MKTVMLRSIGKQSGNQSWIRRRRRLRREGFVEKEGFKPGVKEWGSNGCWQWWVDRRESASMHWNRWVGILETGMKLTKSIAIYPLICRKCRPNSIARVKLCSSYNPAFCCTRAWRYFMHCERMTCNSFSGDLHHPYERSIVISVSVCYICLYARIPLESRVQTSPNFLCMLLLAFSALMLLVERQEGHLACKNWAVRCWRGYLSGARCRLAYGPADAIATRCLLLQ